MGIFAQGGAASGDINTTVDPNTINPNGISTQWDRNNYPSQFFYGGGDDNSLWNQEANGWSQYANMGVQAPGVDPSLINAQNASNAQQQQSGQQEQQAFNLMQSQAMGGDTAAQQQARNTLAYSQDAQNAMMANAGSPQALAAARTQAANSAATQQSMNANSMNALRAQEMATGRSAMGNMANAMRGNEQQLYGLNNDLSYGVASNQMDLNKANDALMLGYGSMANQAQNAMGQIQLGNGQFNLQQNQINNQNAMNWATTATGAASGGLGALGSMNNGNGGGGGGGSGNNYNPSGNGDNYSGDFNYDVENSDERLKTDIARTSLMRPFLDTLAHGRATYRYKNPADEPRVIPTGGRYAGVMAQDLELVPELGHQLVVNTPHGKMVDTKTALSALMAGTGDLHERVKRLEGNREFDND